MPNDDSGYHSTLDVDTVLHVTDKALKIDVDGEQFWLPKSCCTDLPDLVGGEENLTLKVVNWWLDELGFDR